MKTAEIFKLSNTEKRSLSLFAKERLLAMSYDGKDMKKAKRILKFTPVHEAHILACMYNGLADAYFAGLAARRIGNRPKFFQYVEKVEYNDQVLRAVLKARQKRIKKRIQHRALQPVDKKTRTRVQYNRHDELGEMDAGEK
jgi:hypothetical protein